MSENAYNPQVTVVEFGEERAYLVRGLPLPGERVINNTGDVYTVETMVMKGVRYVEGGWDFISSITPIDPEGEKIERMARAIFEQRNTMMSWDCMDTTTRDMYRADARVALAALDRS